MWGQLTLFLRNDKRAQLHKQRENVSPRDRARAHPLFEWKPNAGNERHREILNYRGVKYLSLYYSSNLRCVSAILSLPRPPYELVQLLPGILHHQIGPNLPRLTQRWRNFGENWPKLL